MGYVLIVNPAKQMKQSNMEKLIITAIIWYISQKKVQINDVLSSFSRLCLIHVRYGNDLSSFVYLRV